MAGPIELLVPAMPGTGKARPLAPRISNLRGKTVYLIGNDWLSLDLTYEVIKPILLEKYQVAHVVVKRKADRDGLLAREDAAQVFRNADAVINGLGN